MSQPFRLSLRAKGSLACFSRPEFKTERASYPWITPSAARGIFEAVLWKPEIRWEVRKIALLSPIRFTSFRRNEVNLKVSSTRRIMLTDDDNVRAQRNTVALKDVDYLLEADLFVTPEGREQGNNPVKYREMFTRRLEKGQCFHRPYLGCREFAAEVQPSGGDETPIGDSLDHGLMLYDVEFPAPGQEGVHRPLFFDAKLVCGVVEVPARVEILRRAS